MKIEVILAIIFIHYIADFVFQTDEMAINKSKNNKYLFKHVYIYSLIWYIFGVIYAIYQKENYIEWTITKFFIITFICHFITDWITSRLSSYFYQNNKRHNFFLVIGFDQVLHYFQLFLTYYLLQ